MAVTEYTIHDFDYNKALSGALCIVVSYDCMHPTSPDTPPTRIEDDDADFFGAGIVRRDTSNRLVLVTKGIAYYFKDNGDSIAVGGTPSHPIYLLKLGTIDDPDIQGSLVNDVAVPANITRSENDSTIIDNLSPKDQFAIQALQSMMSKISDPSILSSSEIDNYCKAAYLWADNMLKNAAMLRVGVTDNLAPSPGTATISSLDNNTERLLNNLIQELAKNDIVYTVGLWSKTNQTSVEGEHTDAWVSAHSLGGTTYQTVAAAEADGWSWTAYNAERVAINSMPNLAGTISIGDSGLGRDASHPINDLVHIGSTTNGKGETTANPFYISGKSGTGSDTLNVASTSTISNASGGNLNVKSATGESITIKGNSTYSDMNDVLRVNVVAGGGGGGGSTDVIHIGSSTNGKGESSSYPFYISNTVSNVSGDSLTIKGDSTYSSGGTTETGVLKVQIVAGGGGGGSVDKSSTTTVSSSNTDRIEYITTFCYDAYGTSLFKIGIRDLGVPILTTLDSGGLPQSPQKGYYYKYNGGNLSTVAINLPAATSTANHVVNIIMFNFTCNDSATFTVTPTGSDTVSYRGSNPGSSLSSGTYEVDCVDVGSGWIIGITEIVS